MFTVTSVEQEIKDYIKLLDELYKEENIIQGIDETPLNISIPKKFMDHMLYYGEGKLTDKFYIKNVVTSPTFKKEGMVYCVGDIEPGDYVSTCDVFGICMKTVDEIKAFGKVVSIVAGINKSDKNYYTNIRLINVEFL